MGSFPTLARQDGDHKAGISSAYAGMTDQREGYVVVFAEVPRP